MTFEVVKDNIFNGKYAHTSDMRLLSQLLPLSHVVDEQQSVVWNREKVKELNADIRKQIEEVRTANNKKTAQFKFDLFEAANKEYRFNEDQCEMIYSKVMEYTEFDYISQGLVEDFVDVCDFVYEVWYV